MNPVRKIPLEMFIQTLQELYDNGADYIDISGDSNNSDDKLKDTLIIIVKPEYLSNFNEDEETEEYDEEEISINWQEEKPIIVSSILSDEDINDLI